MRSYVLVQHVLLNPPDPPRYLGGFSLGFVSNWLLKGCAPEKDVLARQWWRGRAFIAIGAMTAVLRLSPCPASAANLLLEGASPDVPLRHRLVISAEPAEHPGRRPKVGLTCGATRLSEMQLVLDFDLGPRWTQPVYAVAIEADGKRLTTLSMAGQLVYLVSRGPEVRRLSRVALTARRLTFETGGSAASFDLVADPDEIEQFRHLCGLDT